MLADVLKELERARIESNKEEYERYNHPYKRDTIIYFSEVHVIGGIEKWIENLSRRFEFSVVYDKGNQERLDQFNKLGIETIKNVGQPIECDTLIMFLWSNKADIRAKKKILFIHGIYTSMEDIGEIPEYDEIYAVSKVAADEFEKTSGREVNVLYNPVDVNEATKPLFLGVFSRLSSEKGRWRIEHLISELERSKRPYLMIIFTDIPFESKGNVVFIKPTMNPTEWMRKCDYIVQLSDTEAGSLTMQESLKLGIPLICTRLPILDEFGINESNSKIIEFDMSNLDIEDLWNIPRFKWQEPISKEWDFMKKKLFRERQEEPKVEVIEEKPKKTKKKVA